MLHRPYIQICFFVALCMMASIRGVCQCPTLGVSCDTPVCTGGYLYLYATGTQGASYSWTGPNNFFYSSSSDVSIANITSSRQGWYYVSASMNGCTVTDSIYVNVISSPSAPTAYCNSPVCEFQTLNLHASSSLSNATYLWYGPNNYNATQQNSSISNVILVDSGDYSVQVYANSGCYSPFTTIHASVLRGAENFYANSNAPLCVGSSLQLSSGSTTSGVSYNWSGPSFSSSLSNPTINNASAANSGNYTVTASVGSCSSSMNVSVLVSPRPSIPSISSNSPACTSDTLKMSASDSVAGVVFLWSGPGNFSSSVQNPFIYHPHMYSGGFYVVHAINGGCPGPSDSAYLVVVQGVDSFYSYSNAPICAGNTLQLNSGSSVSNVSYSWSGPSFSSALQSPGINNATIANSGLYSVTASYNSCVVTAALSVQVSLQPGAPNPGSNSPVCTGSNIVLTTGNSTPGAIYSWTGPSNFSSASPSPTIPMAVWTDTGNYQLTVSLGPCSASGNVHVMVKPIPQQPTMTANSPLCSGDTLKLSAFNANPQVTYSWIGPNNFTSTIYNPAIPNAQVSASGAYYVTLWLNGCSINDTLNSSITPRPVITSAGNNGPLCAGSMLSLSASSSTPGVSYSWTGPNSFTSSLQNPLINNAVPVDSGIYVVTVHLNSCSSTLSTIAAISAALQQPNIVNNSPLCAGGTLNLSALNPNAQVTYSWAGPGNFTSTIYNPNISNAQIASSGVYYVRQSLNACTLIDTINVTIKPLPSSPVLGSNSPVCEGANLLLSANSSPGATFQWSGPQSFSSATANTSINNAQNGNSGVYSVIADLNGCTSEDSLPVTVNTYPTAVSASGNGPLCQGDTLHLNAGSSSIGVSYHWSGPGSFNSSSASPFMAFAQPTNSGTYKVVISLNGCGDTLNVPVSVIPSVAAPSVAINVTPGDSVCVGTALAFSSSVLNAGSPVYTWMKNHSNMGMSNVTGFSTSSLNNGDTIWCTLASSIQCQSVNTALSNKIILKILIAPPAPQVSISQFPPNFNYGTTVTYTGHIPSTNQTLLYAWMINGIVVPGANGAIFASSHLHPSDTVCFLAYSTLTCAEPDSTEACTTSSPAGIAHLPQTINTRLWPNPVSSVLYIEADIPVNACVRSIDGKSIVRKNEAGQIDFSPLAEGLYFVQLYDEYGKLLGTEKVVKVK